jgi:L-alanine-DL-glutamate epimerase-like enolase superfamily enzyme
VKITGISLARLKANLPETEVVLHESHSVPIDLYPQLRELHRSHAPSREVTGIYIEVLTDEPGLSGVYGPIQPAQAQVIRAPLRAFLLGRDPLAGELLLDQMMRLDRHGRSGLFMTGVSPVDCALWDLRGKALGQPVYRLLGGPTRPAVPSYASMLGHSVEPEEAARLAAEFKSAGYQAQKWFFKYGPSDGERGMSLNLAMARAVREAVGPGYRLMFDAFMAWDLSYATAMARGLEALAPFWLEEPMPPERVGAFRRLKRAARVPLATGEHVYTRWQVRELLDRDAVDFVQTDPDWTGGITELTKICALCSAFEVPVVAHGHSLLPALHVAASQSPAVVPMVEYLVLAQPAKQWFHARKHVPVAGEIALPEEPGLGIEIDPSRVESREDLG